jgi:hypothetical protein
MTLSLSKGQGCQDAGLKGPRYTFIPIEVHVDPASERKLYDPSIQRLQV